MSAIVQRHINCQNADCAICLADHEKLDIYLREKIKARIDHLGQYRKWLDDSGIPAETKWGWGTQETFDPKNIESFIKDFLSEEEAQCQR